MESVTVVCVLIKSQVLRIEMKKMAGVCIRYHVDVKLNTIVLKFCVNKVCVENVPFLVQSDFHLNFPFILRFCIV